MKLTTEQLQKINVTVDSYNYIIEDEKIECYCMIAGNDYDTVVTKKEVAAHLRVYNGKIWVTDNSDTQEGYYEIFDNWFDSAITTVDFEDTLEDIINKRENRQPLMTVIHFPDVNDMLDNIAIITDDYKKKNNL